MKHRVLRFGHKLTREWEPRDAPEHRGMRLMSCVSSDTSLQHRTSGQSNQSPSESAWAPVAALRTHGSSAILSNAMWVWTRTRVLQAAWIELFLFFFSSLAANWPRFLLYLTAFFEHSVKEKHLSLKPMSTVLWNKHLSLPQPSPNLINKVIPLKTGL